VPEEKIAIDHREFPPHWPRIGGMDFGWDHPFAAVELVWDRDSDTVYISKTYRLREATPVLHVDALRAWGKQLLFKHLNDWREEFRLYHRKDGKVVKEGDDLMSATRYGCMMLRFAQTKAQYDKFRAPIQYPKMSIA
jgi:hypothetical protein